MMANIRIKNRKVLAMIIALAMVLGLVAPAVFVFAADTHLIGSDTQSGENAATTYVNGLETAKTADDLGDGQYRINLAAKATSATLTPTPTDFELVLDMSGSMKNTKLYTRDYQNLKNHVNWTKVSFGNGKQISHDSLYDADNPDNQGQSYLEFLGSLFRKAKYKDNKYILDPNTPDTYLFLAQRFSFSGSFAGSKTNTYSYTVTDSEGNIYETDEMSYKYTLSTEVYNQCVPSTIEFHLVNPDNATPSAKRTFTIDGFYQVNKASYAAKVYSNDELYTIFETKGLYIIDDAGNKRPVFMEAKRENPNDNNEDPSQNRITDYVYYMTEDDTRDGVREYTTHQGNMIYGAKNGVFQGFKVLVDNGDGTYSVDHERSVEHTTLYQGNTKEDVTNLLAMQETVENFLVNIHRDAAEKNVDQRLGIVVFHNGSNVELKLDEKDNSSHVKEEDIVNKIIQKIYNLDAHNGTRVDLGMKDAQSEFQRCSEGRKTVAVVFTDGKPSESLGSDFSLSKANAAIKTSNQMKTQFGTEVYTVGLVKYADASQLHGDTYFHFDWTGSGKNNVPCNGNVGSSWGATWSSTWTQKTDASGPIDAGAINRFLNYLSSNSPDATDLGLSQVTALFQQGWKVKKNYTVNQEPPHYFAVSTATFGGYDEDGNMKDDIIPSPEELNRNLYDAFYQIAESVKVPSTVIDDTTILHDTITPYFDYVEGSVKVTADGDDITDDKDIKVTVNPETGLVEVTGYDYGANVGKELVVSFLVRRGEDFIGGQNVPTNGIDAGIYDKDRLLEANFPVPLVDVPLQFDNAVTGQSVYYSYEADLTKLINTETLNGVNNDFADVVFTITDDHGNTVGTYTVPAGETTGSWNDGFNAENAYPQVYEDTQYSVTYVVSDTEETLNDTADAMVYVWVPEITVADGETTVGNREDITPELTWVPAGNHNVSEIPALDETADPQVSYKVKDADTNTEISDLDNHLFTANQNFQVYDVTLADRAFVYYTTHIQQATENEYDDNGNIVGDPKPIVDDDGNPVMEEVVVEHQLDRAAADVTAVTKFANKTNADDQTPSEYEWTLSKYSLVIGTEFAGDYANPEDVTYTVTDEDGTVVGTASFSKDDFSGLKTDKTVTIEDLAPGKNYTVTKISGAEKYIVTFTAKDANDAAVADADNDDANQVFGLNYNDSAEKVNLFITNTFDEQYNPPVSGINGGTNLAKLVATIMFVLAGILGAGEVSYIAYLRIRS